MTGEGGPVTVADEESPGVLAEVRKIARDIAPHAAEVDVQGAVDTDVLGRLSATGLLRTFQPARYGGLEGDPVVFFRAIRLLSRACTATGWLASQLGAHAWHLALFDDRAQHDVWGADSTALLSSCYLPEGTMTRVRGGYRLRGRWRTATGARHTAWCFLAAVLLDEQGEPVDYLDVIVPADDYTVERTWDPIGLRAIEADAVAVEDAFVPDYRVFGSRARSQLGDREAAARLAPVFRLPYSAIHTHAVAVPSLGAAEGAYFAMVEDRPEVAALPAVVRAVADLHAAWAQVERNVQELMDQARTDVVPELALAIRARRDQALSASRASVAVSVFLDAAGAEAWTRHHPLQRAWREAQVAQANLANSADDVLGIYGRWACGADISDRWW
ncbi:acyl-CoA dehydrogenase [Nocardioides sp. BGMRC 2183]|nr:acyl-CoA dehydrogenase [Nocardioides sp. BGMRC 2183]